jgi:uncharacterized membrane protein YdjX (TVP38/TMEM64 family)
MNSRLLIKIGVGVALVAGIIALYLSPLRGQLTFEHARDFVVHARGQVRGIWYAPLILIAVYAVGCLFPLPASVFVLAAGAIWGWKLGAAYALTGGVIGALGAYAIGRFLGEGMLDRFGSMGRAVTRQFDQSGLKSMIVLRLIPGPPFALINYGAGVTGVRMRDYFWGTLIGAAPAHVVLAYSADALFRGTMTQGEVLRTIAIVGALLICVIVVPSLLKKRFGSPRATE